MKIQTFLAYILKALDDKSVPVDSAMKKTLEQYQMFNKNQTIQKISKIFKIENQIISPKVHTRLNSNSSPP